MKILIVSATSFEVEPLLVSINQSINVDKFRFNAHEVKLLITNVGATATAYTLGKELAKNQYDLAINTGLAGAFDKHLQ